VIFHPSVYVYIENYGEKDDVCLVAQEYDEIIGAAWSRILARPGKRGYGNIDPYTPELAISVLPTHRGKGVGTALLTALIETLDEKGYSRLSLSVQKENPAFRLYRRVGFEIASLNEEDFIMVKNLSHCEMDIDKLHTTPRGAERIRRNIGANADDVIEWCREAVKNTPDSSIVRRGKNFYVSSHGFVITINAHSNTIITAHKANRK
jgi:hypothetical protein